MLSTVLVLFTLNKKIVLYCIPPLGDMVQCKRAQKKQLYTSPYARSVAKILQMFKWASTSIARKSTTLTRPPAGRPGMMVRPCLGFYLDQAAWHDIGPARCDPTAFYSPRCYTYIYKHKKTPNSYSPTLPHHKPHSPPLPLSCRRHIRLLPLSQAASVAQPASVPASPLHHRHHPRSSCRLVAATARSSAEKLCRELRRAVGSAVCTTVSRCCKEGG
jgi:hypothetical protein